MENKENESLLAALKIIFNIFKKIFIFVIMVVVVAWKTLCELAKKY